MLFFVPFSPSVTLDDASLSLFCITDFTDKLSSSSLTDSPPPLLPPSPPSPSLRSPTTSLRHPPRPPSPRSQTTSPRHPPRLPQLSSARLPVCLHSSTKRVGNVWFTNDLASQTTSPRPRPPHPAQPPPPSTPPLAPRTSLLVVPSLPPPSPCSCERVDCRRHDFFHSLWANLIWVIRKTCIGNGVNCGLIWSKSRHSGGRSFA